MTPKFLVYCVHALSPPAGVDMYLIADGVSLHDAFSFVAPHRRSVFAHPTDLDSPILVEFIIARIIYIEWGT